MRQDGDMSRYEIKFTGRRAYRYEPAFDRWLPIKADEARWMIEEGIATDITEYLRSKTA